MSNFPTGNRNQLSWIDIYTVARQAGFSPAAAVIATAITQPESGRMPGIVQSGQPYRTTGWGLWQITPGDSVPSVGTDNQLLDPLTNAKAAYAKYRGAGDSFRPWTTYNNGAYRAALGSATAAAAQVGDNIAAPIGGGVGGAAGVGGSVGGTPAGIGGTVSPTDVFQAINKLLGSGGAIGQGQVDTIIGGNLSPAIQAVIAAVSGTVDWLSGLVDTANQLLNGLLWLINPSNWLRIIAAILGAASLIGGGLMIARSS